MTYRVIIVAGGDDECPNGTYVTVNGRPDEFDFDTYDAAERRRRSIGSIFRHTAYRVVENTWLTWEDIARLTNPDLPILDDDDDEDDEPERCEDCGNDVDECGGDHIYHECANCDWSCGVLDCDECLYWSDEYGDRLCDDCYERHEHCSTSPGVTLRTMSCCGSGNVHHDDITETYVCDCQAARLVADKRPVTLAHPLPEVA